MFKTFDDQTPFGLIVMMALFLMFGGVCCLGFGELRPTISVNVFLCGFADERIAADLENLLNQFLPTKLVGPMSVSLVFKVEVPDTKLLNRYIEAREGLFSRDSDVNVVFAEFRSRRLSNGHADEYFLVFMNSEYGVTKMKYGNSDVENDCFLLDMKGAFCDVSFADQTAIHELFGRVVEFTDEVLLPETGLRRPPSRMSVPVVSFGPNLLNAPLQQTLNALVAPTNCSIVVKHANIYDFPLIAAALVNGKTGPIFESLGVSQSTIGNTVYERGVYENASAEFQIFVFPSETRQLVEVKDGVAVVFGDDSNAETLVLESVARLLCDFPKTMSFGGHHPFSNTGGAAAFSPILVDTIRRAMAMSSILHMSKLLAAAEDAAQRIIDFDLDFARFTVARNETEELAGLVAKVSYEISSNNVGQAILLSRKAADIAEAVLLRANQKFSEASIFGQCCSETVYISKNLSPRLVILTLVCVLMAVTWMIRRFLQFRVNISLPFAFRSSM